MGNALRILKRDIKRLLKAPAAMVVAIALLVLPSLYTWYNVIAFWDPYGATGNLTVCVVNQDAGVETVSPSFQMILSLITICLIGLEAMYSVWNSLP